MPTETYHNLFLNNDTTTPVHFINSATNLQKPQGTSKPTISMLWTKGPTPQIIDYSVFNHSQFGGQLRKESDLKARLISESDLAKRAAYTALYLGVAKSAVSQSLNHLVRWSFSIGRWADLGSYVFIQNPLPIHSCGCFRPDNFCVHTLNSSILCCFRMSCAGQNEIFALYPLGGS